MIKVHNLYKNYDSLKVLENISFEIKDKEIVAITGPSGCGKTTLLNLIAGLIKPDSGTIEKSTQNIGYVFQEDRLLPWLNIWDNIKLVKEKEDKKEIQRNINLVSLSGFEKYYPNQLSGGMKQRCSIARALYYNSSLLLMDEPFKSLDKDLKHKLLSDVKKINQTQGTTILFVTHDENEAEELNARIISLKNCSES